MGCLYRTVAPKSLAEPARSSEGLPHEAADESSHLDADTRSEGDRLDLGRHDKEQHPG